MTEILSPAGTVEAFKLAIENGADAIYMGLGSFNARNMINNFSLEDYIECIKYAHIYGARVYLTLNILMHDNEIKEAIELLIKLYSKGLDAVILQDIGLFSIIKEVLPDLELHASTQMSAQNLKQVKYLESLGFNRVVLARELTFDEIKYIRENTKCELEIFVHGALCVSYSGQCLMSSLIGNRSGNRGKCAGTCRMKYDFYENDNLKESGYLLSKKDIFGLEYINKLKEIGIDSLKIEGRGKQPEYVGLVTDIYRRVLDGNISTEEEFKEAEKELLQMFNRTSKSTGYFDKVLSKESISLKTPKNTGLYLGKVIKQVGKCVKVKLEEDIDLHDGFEIYDHDKVYSNIVTIIKDENNKIINDKVKSNKTVLIGDINDNISIGSIIYKTSSKSLNKRYLNKLNKLERKVNVPITVNIRNNEKISANVMNEIIYEDYIPEIANSKAADYIYLDNAFSKSGDSYYNFEIVDFNIDSNLFVPMSKLNSLRKNIVNYLNKSVDINIDTTLNINKLNEIIDEHTKYLNNLNVKKARLNNTLFIYKYNKENEDKYIKDSSKIVYINISDIKRDEEILDRLNKEIYIYIPNVVNYNLDKYIENNLERLLCKANGILIGNLGYVNIVENIYKNKCLSGKKFDIALDYSLNIINSYSARYLLNIIEGIKWICTSKEIIEEDVVNISKLTNLEINDNYMTAMTTRFCPVKAYSGKCNCTSGNKYILKDKFNVKYDIVCDNTDCIVKLVRKIDKDNYKNVIIRKNYIN